MRFRQQRPSTNIAGVVDGHLVWLSYYRPDERANAYFKAYLVETGWGFSTKIGACFSTIAGRLVAGAILLAEMIKTSGDSLNRLPTGQTNFKPVRRDAEAVTLQIAVWILFSALAVDDFSPSPLAWWLEGKHGAVVLRIRFAWWTPAISIFH